MNTNILEYLKNEYNGKLIKQTKKETVVYIDDIAILNTLFNDEEKERHEYNKRRLAFRQDQLDYEENTLIGKLLIIKILNSANHEKCCFSISPPCSRLVAILKKLSLT